MKRSLTGILAVVAVLSLIVNVLLYLRYSSARPLVTVGGAAITKKQYLDSLEFQYGPTVLRQMVYSQLVRQAAARAGVAARPQDIAARLADIHRRAPDLLAEAGQDPARMALLRQDLADTIALENLRIKDVTATEAEVAAFYAQNKDSLSVPTQVQLVLVFTRNRVDAATAASLLAQNFRVDVIARRPGLYVAGVNGFQAHLDALGPETEARIQQMMLDMQSGQIQTTQAGPWFLTFKVSRSLPQGLPPLAQIHAQVVRQVKLQKAPSEPDELARLLQATRPRFDMARYARFFTDPTLASVPPPDPHRVAVAP